MRPFKSGRESKDSLFLPEAEGLENQLDEIVDNQLGNTMLRGLLIEQYTARRERAETIFREEYFNPALEAYRTANQ